MSKIITICDQTKSKVNEEIEKSKSWISHQTWQKRTWKDFLYTWKEWWTEHVEQRKTSLII